MKTKTNLLMKLFCAQILILMLCFSNTKAQVGSAPYPITNSLTCDVIVAIEIAKDNVCNMCANYTVTIPANSTHMAGVGCGYIHDIHIALQYIDGKMLSPQGEVGFMGSTCINSMGVNDSGTMPAGSSCTGTWNMQFNIWGTDIW